MRDRGLCKANVDAVAAAPPKHDAWRVPGRRIRGIGQWPPVLGDGDRRQQSCWYPPYWRHSRSSHPQRQRSRWRCRPGFLRRWKQRALIGCPLLALSGHRLVRCTCLLLTQVDIAAVARNFSFDRIEHGRNRRGDMQRRGKTKQSRRIWLGSYYLRA